jgi:arylsulfatase A-like enzyme
MLLCAAHALAGSVSRPNIVFILADDLGINDLACYGRTEHRTPSLDRLAADGARFTSAYCAQPICSPSRAAILSGKSPARLHLTTYLPGRADCSSQKLLHPVIRQELPLEDKSLAEYLRDAGYATACIGKWHLGGQGFGPLEQGFDVYHPGKAVTTPSDTEGGKGEFDLTRAAREFISNNRARPFFLYLAHDSPHIPYSARTNLVERNVGAFEPAYAALIETLDESVGQLLRHIEELGLARDTMVIFTSDNGGLHVPEAHHPRITHNGAHRAGKGYLYEGGLRIPLIIKWPGRVAPGRILDDPVVNTDWLPTLLGAAGIREPRGLDGISFMGLVAGGKAVKNREFFWHFPHYSNQGGRPGGAMRKGDWKLVENYEDGTVELYNLRRDAGERRDVSDEEPRRARQMKTSLAQWRARMASQTNTLNPDFDVASHKALYEDVDTSKFDPAAAERDQWERIAAWRRLMDQARGGAPPARH